MRYAQDQWNGQVPFKVLLARKQSHELLDLLGVKPWSYTTVKKPSRPTTNDRAQQCRSGG